MPDFPCASAKRRSSGKGAFVVIATSLRGSPLRPFTGKRHNSEIFIFDIPFLHKLNQNACLSIVMICAAMALNRTRTPHIRLASHNSTSWRKLHLPRQSGQNGEPDQTSGDGESLTSEFDAVDAPLSNELRYLKMGKYCQ